MANARVMVTAAFSGSGKTTVTCALLQAFLDRGMRPHAFKCGPDYIDPMFHRRVLGINGGNLDLFFQDEEAVRSRAASSPGDITIMEGAMGYYDGLGAASETASAYHVARATQTPAVLVVDAKGASFSLAALIKGFGDFRLDANIQGVLLNRCSTMLCNRMAGAIERETGVQVLGCLPQDERFFVGSRHLGLITAAEIPDFQQRISAAAQRLEESANLDALIKIAQGAPPLPLPVKQDFRRLSKPVSLAVARDEAFCFLYEENLDMLKQLGAEPVFFSPIRDGGLPNGVSGLYLCGGYPELHAQALADNTPMRSAIHAAVTGGMPTVAECGGFLYLNNTFALEDGREQHFCGVFPGRGFQTQSLQRFGYATLTARHDMLLLSKGERMRVHAFHYTDCTNIGNACLAEKPMGGAAWECVHASKTLFAGYKHIYLPGCPHAAQRWMQAMVDYREGIV